MADVLVKLRVILVADFGPVLRPERLDRVDRVPVQLDREGHKVGVLLDDGFDPVRRGEFRVPQLQHDLGSALEVVCGGNLVARLAVARPNVTLRIRPVGAGVNGDAFRRHKGRIKAHAKLPDEPRIPLALFDLLQKRLGAGVGDRPEVFHQLGLRHADARVDDGEGLRRVVRGYVDGKGTVRLENLRARSLLQELEFFIRIRSVGDELPNENFFFCVERMDDDFEKLGDLSLEFVFFGLRHRGGEHTRPAQPREGGNRKFPQAHGSPWRPCAPGRRRTGRPRLSERRYSAEPSP